MAFGMGSHAKDFKSLAWLKEDFPMVLQKYQLSHKAGEEIESFDILITGCLTYIIVWLCFLLFCLCCCCFCYFLVFCRFFSSLFDIVSKNMTWHHNYSVRFIWYIWTYESSVNKAKGIWKRILALQSGFRPLILLWFGNVMVHWKLTRVSLMD